MATSANMWRNARLGGRWGTVEIRRVMAQSLGDATAMDYVLRARAVTKAEAGTFQKARERQRFYEEALRRDPNLVPALLGLTWALGAEIDNDAHIDHDRVVRRMDELTSIAVNLNGAHPKTWVNRDWVLSYLGQWDAALEASAKAIRLDPYSGGNLSHRAWVLANAGGRPAEALALIEQAIAMDPPGDFGEVRTACEAHLLLGQYEQAIARREKAKGLSFEDWGGSTCFSLPRTRSTATRRRPRRRRRKCCGWFPVTRSPRSSRTATQ